MVPSAMLWAPASSGSSPTLLHRIDSPRMKERWARFWLKLDRPAGSPLAGGQGAQLQLVVRPLGQHDGAALGVQRADRVVEDRVQQVVIAFEVNEVMAGPEQGLELLAGARAASRVQGQVCGSRLPRTSWWPPPPSCRTLVSSFCSPSSICSTTRDILPHWMMSRSRSVRSPLPRRMPLRKVPLVLPRSRSCQPCVGGADLGVAAADGAVVEDDFKRFEAAGTQQGIPIPTSCLRGRR